MSKIKMKKPIVEMDGDEMTRVMWAMIKEELISPFINLESVYFDLGLEKRESTGDQVTYDSAKAALEYGVAVKCATITPNAARVKEYNLSKMWPSPNATIRAIMDGTVFRSPIIMPGMTPYVGGWKKPITIARHAYGDIYKAVEIKVPAGSKAELVVTAPDGSEKRIVVKDFETDGIALGMHNTDASIESFARSCFNFALDQKQDLWFGAKDTISKIYDHRFKDIFAEIFEQEYKDKFSDAGIEYFYTLIDDAVARVMRSEGGFIWACKNYDGDVMSDMLATAFGSLALMTSVLVSPSGAYEYEAAHGTVTRHYYRWKNGEKVTTNPIATIYAWTGALRRRGIMDDTPELVSWADNVEKSTVETITSGIMPGDMFRTSSIKNKQAFETRDFLRAIAKNIN